MAVKVSTTHVWNRIMLLPRLLSRIIFSFSVIIILDPVLADGTCKTVLFGASFLLLIFFHVKIIDPWYETLESFLYIRVNLRTNISFTEAREFNELLSPSAFGKWYPLKEIRDVQKNDRRKALFELKQQIISSSPF